MEADDAGAVGLHDEVAAVGFAVLELVGHEVLEVKDFLETLAPQVPDVEDAGMLRRAYANGDVHTAANDAGTLSYLLRDEAGVEVLNAVVVEGIGRIEVYLNALTEGRKRERHDAPTISLGHVLDGIAIADEETTTMVDNPLECIAEEALFVVEDNTLHKLRLAVEADTLYETDILETVVTLTRALRDVEEREGVVLGVAFYPETGYVGVIDLVMARQRELAQTLEAVGAQAVDGGHARVLKADEIVVVDGHALITLLGNALQFSELPHILLRVLQGFAGEEKERKENKGV